MRYFEDFHEGEVVELGTYQVTEAEIINFAKQFDPQPFHISPEEAKHTFYGGLIASGAHTIAIVLRMMVDRVINHTPSMGSPGLDEVRWLNPVRPGDTLHAHWTIKEKRTSKSRTTLGIINAKTEAFNQRGEPVLSMYGTHFLGRRPETETHAAPKND